MRASSARLFVSPSLVGAGLPAAIRAADAAEGARVAGLAPPPGFRIHATAAVSARRIRDAVHGAENQPADAAFRARAGVFTLDP